MQCKGLSAIVPDTWHLDGDLAHGRQLHVSVRVFECTDVASEAWVIQVSPFRLEIGLRLGDSHTILRIAQPGVIAALRLQESLSRFGRIILCIASMHDGMDRFFAVLSAPQGRAAR